MIRGCYDTGVTRQRTIIDLAAELGLSKTTVADALRGSGRVSAATRERVQQAALDAGYVSNRAARQLRTQTSETIGLYIAPDVRNMPFYMPFAFGATDKAADLDYDLMLISRTTSQSESWKHLCGAVVIDALPGDPTVHSLLASGIPVVSAGRVAGEDAASVAGVIEVEYAPMCAAILDELQQQGTKAPALIAPEARDPLSWSQQIRDGYTQWCEQNAIQPVIVSLSPFPDNMELEDALKHALHDGGVDALLFGWHEIADRAELLLETMGYDLTANMHLATLTSSSEDRPHSPYSAVLDLRPRAFGEAAIEMLHEIIRTPESAPLHQEHKPEIRVRHTASGLNSPS